MFCQVLHHDYLAIKWTIIPGRQRGSSSLNAQLKLAAAPYFNWHFIDSHSRTRHGITTRAAPPPPPPLPSRTPPIMVCCTRRELCHSNFNSGRVAQKSTNAVWYNNTFPFLFSSFPLSAHIRIHIRIGGSFCLAT